MNGIVKLPVFLYIAAILAYTGEAAFIDVVLLLLAAALTVWRERFWDSLSLTAAVLVIVAIGLGRHEEFAVLLCAPLFDFVRRERYEGAAITAGIALWGADRYGWSPEGTLLFPLLALYGLFAYRIRLGDVREKRHKQALDEERRLRYELETAKAKLLRSAQEIAVITEVKERNRIARDIHDSVGHSLAGILIQLQASQKMLERGVEPDKAGEMLKGSVTRLSETVGLLRDTVHNIKPKQELGVEYIKGIIESFRFCEVDFRFSGDVRSLPPDRLELVASVIKEALTNAAKHSGATLIEIRLDITEAYLRLMIRDNGRGCAHIKEGLGLSGMRERIRNTGGSFSAGGEDGFTIVGLIPGEGGERIFEDRNR